MTILGAQAPRFSHGVSAVAAWKTRFRLVIYTFALYTGYVYSTYRSNRNVFFSCKYHVVWCPKYRRSVLVDGADEALRRIVERVCLARDADLIELEVMPDHVHLLVDIDPQYGIHRLVKEIKGTSSRELRASFPFLKSRLPTLWTNSYFVSTVGGAPLAVVKQYIENQKHV